MSATSAPRPPWGRALAGIGVLAAGTVALQARAVAVIDRANWQFYRQEQAGFLRMQARLAAKHLTDTWTGPVRPSALTPWRAVEAASSTSLTLLVAGLGSLLLIALGRRVLWLPVAVGALAVAPVGLVSAYETKTATTVGVAASVALIALAGLPLLTAPRAAVVPRAIPARLASLVLGGAAALAVYLMLSTGNNSFAAPSGPVAVLVYGMLVGGSALPQRWLPLALMLPVLGLTQVSDALHDPSGWSAESELTALAVTLGLLAYGGIAFVLPLSRRWVPLLVTAPLLGLPPVLNLAIDAAHGYFPGVAPFYGPIAVTLGASLLGAGVPLYGPHLTTLWRTATQHGPALTVRRSAGAPA